MKLLIAALLLGSTAKLFSMELWKPIDASPTTHRKRIESWKKQHGVSLPLLAETIHDQQLTFTQVRAVLACHNSNFMLNFCTRHKDALFHSARKVLDARYPSLQEIEHVLTGLHLLYGGGDEHDEQDARRLCIALVKTHEHTLRHMIFLATLSKATDAAIERSIIALTFLEAVCKSSATTEYAAYIRAQLKCKQELIQKTEAEEQRSLHTLISYEQQEKMVSIICAHNQQKEIPSSISRQYLQQEEPNAHPDAAESKNPE